MNSYLMKLAHDDTDVSSVSGVVKNNDLPIRNQHRVRNTMNCVALRPAQTFSFRAVANLTRLRNKDVAKRTDRL
jgi:hypothetical protein